MVVRESLTEVSEAAAAVVQRLAAETVRRRGVFALALSGGLTPGGLFHRLAALPREVLPWQATQVYWCDERCVPPDHPESNYRLAREALLDRVAVPPGNIHRIAGEDSVPNRAAEHYAAMLPSYLDLMLLGLGEDGHTASLFPGSAALTVRDRPAVAVVAPKPPLNRITVTPPVIDGAAELLVLVAGAGKAAAVARALTGPEDITACPGQLARRGLWFLDREAASALPARLAKNQGTGTGTETRGFRGHPPGGMA